MTPKTGADLGLTSSAFGAGQAIPRMYTCDGGDHSPPLQWGSPPAGTASLALVVEDPDALGGTFTHWLIYALPATTRGLPESVPVAPAGPDGSRQGMNGFGQAGYGGPCPPGGTHHYYFRLYALDTALSVPAAATVDTLRTAMNGHVLARGEWMGTYSR
ncbi:MAG TPA: YbhB/YbcL family Raf kinase inhibitor-like protein [Chloroflexia bacterium]|nr:YbhB/YbcL family Raf kinase inhibitor-like protein [Chloroflexia bacterium]